MKELAIIILDWNGAEDTIECLNTLSNHSLYDIYLLDNGSKAENNTKLARYFNTIEYDGKVVETTVNSLEIGKSPITYVHSESNLGL